MLSLTILFPHTIYIASSLHLFVRTNKLIVKKHLWHDDKIRKTDINCAVILPSFSGHEISSVALLDTTKIFSPLSLLYCQSGVTSPLFLLSCSGSWSQVPEAASRRVLWMKADNLPYATNTCCRLLMLLLLLSAYDTENSRRGPVVAGPWLFWDWEANNGHTGH